MNSDQKKKLKANKNPTFIKMIKGFTLLELIIVIVIIGALSALAMPRFTKIIERSRGVEGINILMSFRSAMERCYIVTRDYKTCVQRLGIPPYNFPALGLEDPSTAVNSHFSICGIGVSMDGKKYETTVCRNTYELLIPSPPTTPIAICENGMGGQIDGIAQITLCVNNTTVQIIGSGIYEGI